MSGAALLLIIGAAVAHASWNLMVKRAAGGAAFLFVSAAVAAVLWAPLALVVADGSLSSILLAVAVSGSFHLTYFLTLQAGYRAGDLSLVYPLARGTGPAISVVVAIVIRDERPAVLALVGAAAVVLGLLALARGHAAGRSAIAFGVATGVVIAGYTLWDKHAVDDLGVAAVTLSWGTDAVRALLLTSYALRRRALVRQVWRTSRRDAIGLAVLSPLAYILVLVALTTTDVAFVAPAREVSIVIGVILGRVVLHETVGRRRMASAAIVATGVVMLAIA